MAFVQRCTTSSQSPIIKDVAGNNENPSVDRVVEDIMYVAEAFTNTYSYLTFFDMQRILKVPDPSGNSCVEL